MSCPIACPVGLRTVALFPLVEGLSRRDSAATHDMCHGATK